MTCRLILLALLAFPMQAFAGLHDSGEKYAELPSSMRGFLLDHRALRSLASQMGLDGSSLFREGYVRRMNALETAAKVRPLSTEEAADLGAILIRLGRVDRAVEVLFEAQRAHPNHFRLTSNLATASQLRGDLDRAASLLDAAVRLAPEELREVERAHLRLVRLRAREEATNAAADGPDDLFGPVRPKNALAIAQQLALWLPGDARLLWHVGELAHAHDDIRTASAILEGCVTELGLTSDAARKRRQELREAVDAIDQLPEEKHPSPNIPSRSSRPLLNRLDAALLPTIKPDQTNVLPWIVLSETTIGKGFRPKFLSYLDKLEGRRVSLTGFMRPLGDGPDLTGFLLVEFPVGCWFCESPDLTGVVQVEMPTEQTTPFVRGLIKVDGTLNLNRTDPERYLFSLIDAHVGEPD